MRRPSRLSGAAAGRLQQGDARPRGVVDDHEAVGDPTQLAETDPPLRRVHQHAEAHGHVERAVRELERVGVANRKRDGRLLVGCALAGHGKHRLGRVNARDPGSRARQQQRRAARAGADVEDATVANLADETGEDTRLLSGNQLPDRSAETSIVERPGSRWIGIDGVAVMVARGFVLHATSFTSLPGATGASDRARAPQALRVRSR